MLEMSKHSTRRGSASSRERLLQPVEGLHALLAAALGAQLLLVERELRVALGELEDAALAPALGGADLDRPVAALGQHLGEHRELGAVGQLALHHDQRRDRHRARVVLEQELLGRAGDVVLALVVEVEGLAVGEDAVADLEDLRVRLRRRPPRPRPRRRCRRGRRRRAGARAARAPTAGGCARSSPARSPAGRRRRTSGPRGRARSRGSGRTGTRSRRRCRRGTPPWTRSPRRAPRSA